MKKGQFLNKFISLVLAVCMVASLFAGLTIGAFAEGTHATEVIYCGHTLNASNPYLIVKGLSTGGITVAVKSDKTLWGAENLLAEFDAKTGTLTYKSGMMVEADANCYEQDLGWNSYCDVAQIGEDYYGIKANGDLTIDLSGHKNFIYANWNKIFTSDLYGIYAEGDVTIKGDGYLKLPATLAMNKNASKGDNNATPHNSYGIYAQGDVNLDGGAITIFSRNLNRLESGSNANSTGIYAGGKIKMNGTTLKFRYEENVGQGKITHFNKNPEGVDLYRTKAITNIVMTGSLGSLGYCYVNDAASNTNCYDYFIPQSATGVLLSRRSIKIEKGEQMTLSATVMPYEAENKNVTWSTSNGKVATVVRGRVTGVSKGTAIITVTTNDGGYTAECTVKVTEEVPQKATVERVELDRTEFDLSAGSSRVINATVYPKNAEDRRVEWSSSDERVATVDGGKVTAIAPGRATITARTAKGGYTDSCTVNVPGRKTSATEVIYCGRTLNAETPYLVSWVVIGKGLQLETRATKTLTGDEVLLAEFDAQNGIFTYKSGMSLSTEPGGYEPDYVWNTYGEAAQIGNDYYGIKANGDLVINLGGFNNFIYGNWNKIFTCNLYGIYADGDVTINGNGYLKLPATFAMNTSANGDGNAAAHYSYGIYAQGDVNLNGGKITIFSKVWMEGQTGSNAHSVGIYAGDKINLNAVKLRFRYEDNIGQGKITHFSSTPAGMESYNKVPVNSLKMADGDYASLGFCYVDKSVNNENCFDYDPKYKEAESKVRIAFTDEPVTLLIDGVEKSLITPVKIADNGVVYVPLVETFGILGVKMTSYTPDTYAGYGNNGEIIVRVHDDKVDIDWVDVELPSPVTKLGGVTMIPAYILEDALKIAPAVYDEAAGTLSVTTPDPDDVFRGDTRSDIGERMKETTAGETILTQSNISFGSGRSSSSSLLVPSNVSVAINGAQTTALQLETKAVSGDVEPDYSDIVTYSYIMSGTGKRDFNEGDTAIVRFKARTLNATGDANAGRLSVYYERTTDWSKLFSKDIVIRPGEWTEYYIPVCATKKGYFISADWSAKTSRLVFGTGKEAQTIQIADFEMIYYGQTVDIETLDPYFYSYYGIDDDALWRKEAWRKIEKHRKEDVAVTVVDQNGDPVEGAEIQVKQTESDFMFGIEVCHNEILELDLTGEIGRAMDEAFDSFNTVVCGLEMKAEKVIYSDGVRGMKMVDEIFSRNKRLRGHAVLWDRDELMNVFSPTGNYREMEYEDIYRNIMDYIEPYVYAYKGKVVQWDVLNEISYWNYTRTEFDTTRLYTDVINAVHRIDPDTKIYVNEYATEGKDKGQFERVMGNFLDLIKRLREEGAHIDGLGLQTHANNYHNPWGIYRQIDECAQVVDEVSITEYDFGNDYAKATDRYKYMIDHLIATVAHPKSSSFVVWGYRALSQTVNKGFFYDISWNELPLKDMWDKMVNEEFKTNLTVNSDENGRADFRGFHGDYEITVNYGGAEKTFDFGLLKDGKNEIKITVGDSIRAEVSSGKYIVIPESVDYKSVTDAELHYRNNVSTIPYREVLLDANLKNVLAKGVVSTSDANYLNGNNWGSGQNMSEIATDRYQNRGMVFKNSKSGSYTMNRLYSGKTFENGNLELSCLVETLGSRKAGFELGLGLGNTILGKVKTSAQGYYFETLSGRRFYLADNTIYDIQTTLIDTGFAGVYDLKYVVKMNGETLFEIIEEQDEIESITALDRIVVNANANGAGGDVLVLRLARAMFHSDGTYEFSDINNEAEVISDSMYEFDVDEVVADTDAAYLRGDAWGTNTDNVKEYFKYYHETHHIYGVRTAPDGEKTLKHKMVQPTSGEALDVEFDFYIATPQVAYDSPYYFEVRLENANGSISRTLARSQSGTILQLLESADGVFANQQTVEYNDIVGITKFNKNNLRIVCKLAPNSSGNYDATLTLANHKSETVTATIANFLTEAEFTELDTFTIASATLGAGSRYGQGVAGVKNVRVTRCGKADAFEGDLMAFEEGEVVGIRFENPTKRPMDAQVMLVRYVDDKFSSVDVYTFDDRKQEEGYLSIPVSKKSADENKFMIMLVDGEGNMKPLKAADDIVIY